MNYLPNYTLILGLSAYLFVTNSANTYGQSVSSSPEITPLLAQLQETEQKLELLEGRIPATQRKVDDLIRQVAALEEKRPRLDKDPPNKGVRRVPFRLPRMQRKKLASPALIVCENNRLTIFNIDAAMEAIEARFSGTQISGVVKPPPGHFIGEYSYGSRGFQITLSRNANRRGETIQQISSISSEFQRYVRTLNSKTDAIQFFVYPDSYDAFRHARSIVWEKEFDVRWIPLGSGDPLIIGGGGGSVSVD